MALLAIGSNTHMGILFKSFHTNQALASYWVQHPSMFGSMWKVVIVSNVDIGSLLKQRSFVHFLYVLKLE
jgi:hypothetical protein